MKFLHKCGVLTILFLLVATGVWAEGSLRYAGATTLQRFFMPEIARQFNSQTAIKVDIEGGNTGPGIRALLNGDVDLAGAGRHLTAEEKSKGLVEHFLGWDVLAIIVNEKNPVQSLTLDQLQGIFSGEIKDWGEVGGNPGPILVVTSPRGAGMRTAVKKLILKDKNFLSREVVSAIVAESDQQVSMFATGITALSRSMLDAKGVKMIRVNDVEPTAQNIASGTYPLAKPLALVTMGQPKGDLARLLDLVFSDQGKAVLRKSFVPVE